MDYSYTSSKSPMKSMFSSVFKREDIRLSHRNSSYNQPDSYPVVQNRDFTPTKSSNSSLRFTTPDHTIKKNTSVNKTFIDTELYKETSSCNVTREKKFNDTKYEDLVKKYERMQEFYKSQISCLNDEVEHYKSLYQKLIAHQNAERKY